MMRCYIMCMAKTLAFDKIENFVKEHVTSQVSVMITEIAKGYKVNNFRILQKDNQWAIVNPVGNEITNLYSRRLAILSAAFASKKRFTCLPRINALDFQLSYLKHDKRLFEKQINKSINQDVLEDRLSRVIDELEKVYLQISELEKSVGLQ